MQRDMLLERGQVRMAQNTTLHRLHEEEIALGIALGPVSGKHRLGGRTLQYPVTPDYYLLFLFSDNNSLLAFPFFECPLIAKAVLDY